MKRNKYHMKTKEGDEWLRRITEFGCIVCHQMGYQTPASAHHPRDKKTGRPVQDAMAIPLCAQHHQTGGAGVAFHATGRRTWEAQYGTEADLLAAISEILDQNRGISCAPK